MEALRSAEAAHAAADPVVRAASGAAPLELLRTQCVELAREAAALRFERLRTAPGSKELGRLISRRIRALRFVADAVVQLHHLHAGTPSPAVTRHVLELLTDDVLAAAREVLDGVTADRFENAVRKRVEPLIADLVADGR